MTDNYRNRASAVGDNFQIPTKQADREKLYTKAEAGALAYEAVCQEREFGELSRLRAALKEIELRTRAYADAADWPLVSGVHAVAREALRDRTQ